MIVFLIIGLILIFIALFILHKANNIKINKTNEQQKTQEKIKYLQHQKNQLVQQLQSTNQILDNKKKQLNNFYSTETEEIKKRIQDFKEVASQAANLYADNLQEVYSHAEARYEEKITRLEVDYSKAAASLQQLKETRKAAYEALLKEKEIKEKSIFYTVQLDKKYQHDINLLNSISNQLIDSRPLNMVIWTSYYSKKVNELCARIIGTKIKSGIYKITFLPTNQCYIGQAKDLKERIRTHIKAGSCRIDTPSNNKLYEKMKDNSIQNFTFQILEQCPIEKLNQKEKFYIDLYQSYDYGFNGNRGISK